MDRLISEKAVLEAFREYQGSISDFYKAVKAIPSAEPCESCCNGNQEKKAMLCQKSYLAGMEHRDMWIPVSERLPEEKMAVLVWCPEYKNIYCAYLEKKQWWIFGAFVQIIPYAVIAWMPLPPCYDPQERSK